jgi:superfamily II DNA or RNA helicase
VFAATTAFGKTVVAAALIAQRGRNALVLVYRRKLLTQWVERLRTFLDIDPKDIGVIGGGRRKPTGVIDVALIQSLVRRGEVSDLVADYGHLIVDECHHLSAASFELVARRAKARYVLGLSATVARKEGHHPIIFMQCGPVRHRVDARAQAAGRGIVHRARPRSTQFQLPPPLAASDHPSMPEIYAAIAQDESRNNLIFDDVLKALEAKRSPVVLTGRRDHLEYLQKRFSRFVRNLVVLRGGMSTGERKMAEAALRAPGGERWPNTSAVCTASMTGRPRLSSSTMLMRWSQCWRAWQQNGERDIGRSAIGLSNPPPAAHRLTSSSVPVRRRSI